jgi:hypothetical protein
MDVVESLLHVKDCVIDGMKGEITRLQQYTRRYSVDIAGIPKPRGENPADLRKIINEIVTESESTTTVADIDKVHRNGPADGEEQDVILRFKSHSAKEAFYKARKTLGEKRKDVKIRPSLAPAQRTLLNDARDYLKTQKDAILPNPPEFVFANIHGQIQVKMSEKCKMSEKGKEGLFVTINSVDHLTRVIGNANMLGESFQIFDKDNSWADATGKRGNSNDDGDYDMGFGLFV